MNRAAGLLALALWPQVLHADAPPLDGAQVFADNCAACHAEGGVGAPGFAPPLNLPEFWAGLGPRAPDYLAGVLSAGLAGRITAGGMDYIGLAMPAQTELSDAEAAAVATYVLHTLGGLEDSVSSELIARTRAAPPAHADLRKIRKGE